MFLWEKFFIAIAKDGDEKAAAWLRGEAERQLMEGKPTQQDLATELAAHLRGEPSALFPKRSRGGQKNRSGYEEWVVFLAAALMHLGASRHQAECVFADVTGRDDSTFRKIFTAKSKRLRYALDKFEEGGIFPSDVSGMSKLVQTFKTIFPGVPIRELEASPYQAIMRRLAVTCEINP